jgi:hypothetical protein
MALTDNDKLNLALEIMSSRDVEKFMAIVEIADEKNINIYSAIDAYEWLHKTPD